jgi:hypothetical protein
LPALSEKYVKTTIIFPKHCKLINIFFYTKVITGGKEETKGWLVNEDFV